MTKPTPGCLSQGEKEEEPENTEEEYDGEEDEGTMWKTNNEGE